MERRLLILGEGYSHDPHHGKTMRGIIRYGPDPVVAILDSARAGEEHEGIPIVGSVEDALRFRPTVAVVGVATTGGRFPPAWRELLNSDAAEYGGSGIGNSGGVHAEEAQCDGHGHSLNLTLPPLGAIFLKPA